MFMCAGYAIEFFSIYVNLFILSYKCKDEFSVILTPMALNQDFVALAQ